jgi:hypothetical protein
MAEGGVEVRKQTKKGKTNGSDYEARARAIIDSPDRYDEETRHTISNLLREGSEDLAAFVKRAEDGEEVFDLVHPLPSAKEERQAEHGAQETPARRDARRLLERMKQRSDEREAYKDSGLYEPITLEQALKLTEKIITQGDDDAAHAFIALLHGITAAHYAEKREGYRGPDAEGLVIYATHRAYSRTTHFSDSVSEFTQLDADTFNEIDALRGEYYGEEGGEG